MGSKRLPPVVRDHSAVEDFDIEAFGTNFATLEQKKIPASMEFMAREVLPKFAGA
jgi:hypothetical protein